MMIARYILFSLIKLLIFLMGLTGTSALIGPNSHVDVLSRRSQRSIHAPQIASTPSIQKLRLMLSLEPTDVLTSSQNLVNLIQSDNPVITAELSSLLSTLYSATAGAAKYSQQWSFLWFHGGSVDPYNNGLSIAPLNNANYGQVNDFFIPNSVPEVTRNILSAQQSGNTGISTLSSSADLIKITQGMPGAPVQPQVLPNYVYKTKIDKDELESIARNVDLVSRRIPLAVTIFALVDFFIFGGRDVLSGELEENRGKLAFEWVKQASIRVGVGFIVVLVTILVSYVTYHPL